MQLVSVSLCSLSRPQSSRRTALFQLRKGLSGCGFLPCRSELPRWWISESRESQMWTFSKQCVWLWCTPGSSAYVASGSGLRLVCSLVPGRRGAPAAPRAAASAGERKVLAGLITVAQHICTHPCTNAAPLPKYKPCTGWSWWGWTQWIGLKLKALFNACYQFSYLHTSAAFFEM